MKFSQWAALGACLMLSVPVGCGPDTSKVSLSPLGSSEGTVSEVMLQDGLSLARSVVNGQKPNTPKSLASESGRRVMVKFHNGARSVAASGLGGDLASSIEMAASALKKMVRVPKAGRLELTIIESFEDLPLESGVYAPPLQVLGVEGYAATDGESFGFVLPSETVSQELWDQETRTFRLDAVKHMLAFRAGVRRDDMFHTLDDAGVYRLMRFNGPSMVERAPGGQGRLLQRALPQRDYVVSSASLREAATSGAEYLQRQQGKDGKFLYLYHTVLDNPGLNDNVLHQAAAGLALLDSYERVGKVRFKKAGLKSADYILGLAADQPGNSKPKANAKNFKFLKDGSMAKTGGTARGVMLLTAAFHQSNDKKYLEGAQAFGRNLLFLQKANGELPSYYRFGPKASVAKERGQYLGSGLEAFLELYAADGQKKWLKAAQKLGDHILKAHKGKGVGKVPVTPWYVRSLINLSQVTGDAKYAKQGVRVAKGQLPQQHKAGNGQPDFVGGFERPPATLGTADKLIEMAYAYQYELENGRSAPALWKGSLAAAKFLRTQQFDSESAYYVIRPKRVSGGLRNGFISNKVRIDYVHRAMVGFFALAELLKADEAPE